MKWKEYFAGVRRALPVGLGYLSVSFGFGAMAAANGIAALDAGLMSFTTLAGAGQFNGLTLIVAGVSLWELILAQFVINSRYALMSLALSQRMGRQVGFFQRLLISFINTDEIFALAMAEKPPLTVPFMLGLGLLPILGWTGGTLLGGLAGSVLPLDIRTALGTMFYGMFIAIVVPPAKQEKSVRIAVALSVCLSCLLTWVPGLKEISSGIATVICTVAAASVCAVLFPVEEEAAE